MTPTGDPPPLVRTPRTTDYSSVCKTLALASVVFSSEKQCSCAYRRHYCTVLRICSRNSSSQWRMGAKHSKSAKMSTQTQHSIDATGGDAESHTSRSADSGPRSPPLSGSGRTCDACRLHRWPDGLANVQQGLLRQDRPQRSGQGRLRPVDHLLRGAGGQVFLAASVSVRVEAAVHERAVLPQRRAPISPRRRSTSSRPAVRRSRQLLPATKWHDAEEYHQNYTRQEQKCGSSSGKVAERDDNPGAASASAPGATLRLALLCAVVPQFIPP